MLKKHHKRSHNNQSLPQKFPCQLFDVDIATFISTQPSFNLENKYAAAHVVVLNFKHIIYGIYFTWNNVTFYAFELFFVHVIMNLLVAIVFYVLNLFNNGAKSLFQFQFNFEDATMKYSNITAPS